MVPAAGDGEVRYAACELAVSSAILQCILFLKVLASGDTQAKVIKQN